MNDRSISIAIKPQGRVSNTNQQHFNPLTANDELSRHEI